MQNFEKINQSKLYPWARELYKSVRYDITDTDTDTDFWQYAAYSEILLFVEMSWSWKFELGKPSKK